MGVAGLLLISSALFSQVNPIFNASLGQDVILTRSFSAPSPVPHSVSTGVGPAGGESPDIPTEGRVTVPSGTGQVSLDTSPPCDY